MLKVLLGRKHGRLNSTRYGRKNFHSSPMRVHLVAARGLKVLLRRKHGLDWLPLGKVGRISTPGLSQGSSSGHSRGIKSLERKRAWLRLASTR